MPDRIDQLIRTVEGEDFCGVCHAPNPAIKFVDKDGTPQTYCLRHAFTAFYMWLLYGKYWQRALFVLFIACLIVAIT